MIQHLTKQYMETKHVNGDMNYTTNAPVEIIKHVNVHIFMNTRYVTWMIQFYINTYTP